MIQLCSAGVRRGSRWIFRDLTLQLEHARSLAVLGPNGRGKTTLIRAAMGLLPLSEGRRAGPALIGYVPQVLRADVPYRARDFVVTARAPRIGLFGTPGRQDLEAADLALARVGLTHRAHQPLDKMSGGERQLVALARALATESPILVLDEPMSALDLANQSRLLAVLNELRADGRHSILFSTHMPEHALAAADQALLMLGPDNHLIGPATDVLSGDNLSRLYGLTIHRTQLTFESGREIEAIIPDFQSDYMERTHRRQL